MIELGLQRISRLLSKTHLPWRAIHVAGTNGKGSICVYISGMLEAYNNSSFRKQSNRPPIRHGRFTSPHLIDRWDCISINQKPVSSALFHEIEKKVLLRNASEAINASEFELLTATAFEIFTHENVDIGVIEVGMGGRLDATNILGQEVVDTDESGKPTIRAKPLVTAIAKIGLDHQSFLGNTLQAIAAEKAGILKPNVPLVYDGSNPTEVLDTFRTLASEIGAPTPKLANDNHQWPDLATKALPPSHLATLNIPAETNATRTKDTDAPLHTKQNTSVAFHATLLALSQLPSHSAPFPSALLTDLLSVPAQTIFPGRLQPLSIHSLTDRTQPVLLDGAHNAQSAAVLESAVTDLRSRSPNKSVTWVLAASDSKDIASLLRPLLRTGDAAFAVEFEPVDGMPWVKPMASEKVLHAAREVLREKGQTGEIVGQALASDVTAGLRAASEAADGGPLVVAGSLYLVGSVLRALRRREEEP